jgi:hypothetical protein
MLVNCSAQFDGSHDNPLYSSHDVYTHVQYYITHSILDDDCTVEDDCTVPVDDDCTVPVDDDCTVPVEDDCTVPVDDDCTVPVDDDCTVPVDDDCTVPVDNSYIVYLLLTTVLTVTNYRTIYCNSFIYCV